MELPCNDLTIGLDNGKGDYSFVSHAHSDHLNGARKKRELISSEETIALAGLNAKPVLPFGIELHHAGHMLGAKQISIEHDGKKSVYTGDLCLHPTLTNPGAKIVECDHLILDATYAKDDYKFPKYEDVLSDIAKWVKQNDSSNIIIGCYNMGKAQEMVKILNELCGLAPLVTEKADEICAIYEDFGIKLDRISINSNEAEEALSSRFVALVSMRHAKRYFAQKLEQAYGRRAMSAVVTGWALRYQFNVDRGFPLSDHADFEDLKYYVEQSGAKKVDFHSGEGHNLLEACGFGSPMLLNNPF